MKLALVPVALAALLVAGCGGSSSSSSSPSPQDWADSLCSSITTWSNSVKTAGESLKSGSLSKGDLKNTTSEIKSATNQFADELKSLGQANTDAGQRGRRPVAERGHRRGRHGYDEGRRDRRLEHRHHPLDDEHSDRLGRLE